MANEIRGIAPIASPVQAEGTAPKRSHPDTADPSTFYGGASPAERKALGRMRSSERAERKQERLKSDLEHLQSLSLAQKTSVSFEREGAGGSMILLVKDKRTGEELYRIPKDNIPEQPAGGGHKLDVRI